MKKQGRKARNRRSHGAPPTQIETTKPRIQYGVYKDDAPKVNSDASSAALDMCDSSEVSHADYESSVATSFVSGSEASSTVETGHENDELETASFESRRSVIGGWFDYACGWMDRPTMCLGVDDGKATSLLRESKLQTSKTMRKVQMNETLSRVAKEVAVSGREREVPNVDEQHQVENAEHSEIEQGVEQEMGQKEEKRKKRISAADAKAAKRKGSAAKTPESAEEALEARMKQVSARASEIMKTTMEAETIEAAEQAPSKSKPVRHAKGSKAKMSPCALRERVMKALTDDDANLPNTVFLDINVPSDFDDREGCGQFDYERGQTETSREANEEPFLHEIVNVEDLRVTEDDDIQSLSEYLGEKTPGTESKVLEPAARYDKVHTVTDLTHIQDEDHLLPAPPSVHVRTENKKLNQWKVDATGRNGMQVIDVLDVEGESQWVSGVEPITEEGLESSAMPQKDAPGRRKIESHVINLWEEEEKKLEAKLETHKKGMFKDLDGRETLGELHRGRLETFGTDRALPPRSPLRMRSLRTEIVVDEVSKPTHGRRLRSNAPVSRRRLEQKDTKMPPSTMQQEERRLDPPPHEVSLELRRRAMASQPRGLGDHHDADSDHSNRSSINLVSVRSIDEAQRDRKTKPREFNDKTFHPSKHMDMSTLQYWGERASNRDEPIVASELLRNPPSRLHAERGAQNPRLRDMAETKLSPLGLAHRTEGAFDTDRNAARNNREKNYDFVNVPNVVDNSERRSMKQGDIRGRDVRDDFSTGFDPSGDATGLSYFEESDSAKVRRMNRQPRGDTSPVQDLGTTWGSSAMKLTQTFQNKEDEKRAARLRRLKSRNQSRRLAAEMQSNEFRKANVDKDVATPPRPRRDRTTMDSREGKSKYDQLRVLRQSRPMHKYMQRSHARPGAMPRPEAY